MARQTPVLVSVGTSTYADTTNTCVITKPVGLAVGDLMVAQIGVRRDATTTVSPPADWTELNHTHSSNLTISAIFWKIAVAGDVAASDFTFSLSATQDNHGAISAFRGFIDTDPFSAITAGSGTGTTVTTATITPDLSGGSLLLFFAADSVSSNVASWAVATSNPATWTEAYDLAGTNISLAMAYAWRPEATGTGNATATLSSGSWVGQITAINAKEAGGAFLFNLI